MFTATCFVMFELGDFSLPRNSSKDSRCVASVNSFVTGFLQAPTSYNHCIRNNFFWPPFLEKTLLQRDEIRDMSVTGDVALRNSIAQNVLTSTMFLSYTYFLVSKLLKLWFNFDVPLYKMSYGRIFYVQQY
jgi:hypothetical protein